MVGNPPSPKLFACPSCGASVVIRALGKSLSVCCGSCGSIIDPSNENYQIIAKCELNANIKPIIPLGTRGKIKGDVFECIGFVIRDSAGYSWREFLLYNPFKGFRWLTEYDGHWTFVTMIKDRPKLSGGGFFNYLGTNFRPMQSGMAVVKYVLGEFYWRVKVGETVEYADFVAPPRMLSSEGGKDEMVWSLAEYIEPEDVRTGFAISTPFPSRMGTGACQPFSQQELLSNLWAFGFAFSVILFLIHMAVSGALFWNFLVCVVLVLAPPIALQWYKNSFEKLRWGDEE